MRRTVLTAMPERRRRLLPALALAGGGAADRAPLCLALACLDTSRLPSVVCPLLQPPARRGV